MAVDTAGNVAVDFVWGNLPMQPDDERAGDGTATEVVAADAAQNKQWSGYSVFESDTLDAALGNHIVATTQYNGFPGYTPVAPYLDTIANKTVPTVTSLTEAAATTALTNAGLVKGTVTTSTAGATALNDGKVKSQSVTAGSKVNAGTAVNLVLFDYETE